VFPRRARLDPPAHHSRICLRAVRRCAAGQVNLGQPLVQPENVQVLRSVAQAEASGGVAPLSNSATLPGNGPPGYWLY
jgi:hypothetical protein